MQVERICAQCGKTNPFSRSVCGRCGGQLSTLPARAGERHLTIGHPAAAMTLALGAGALLARAGLQVFTRLLLPHAWKSLRGLVGRTRRAKAWSIVPKDTDQGPDDTVVRGWRVWSVRRDGEEHAGSEQFEWRIRGNRAHAKKKR